MATILGTLYKYEGKRFRAFGYYKDGFPPFVVCEGSVAALASAPSLFPYHRGLRQKLIRAGVLREQDGGLVFATDWSFSSLSAAACVVCGCSRNGHDVWTPVDGSL